jgi:hypothetical protein
MLKDRAVNLRYAEYVASLQISISGWNKQLNIFVLLFCEYRCLDSFITLEMENA